MVVSYWGVRGSIATPAPHTVRYGGNTSCVSVRIPGKILVIDAGSGIRRLGRALEDGDEEIFLLLSHPHRDHTDGFPFFGPLHQPGRVVHLVDYVHGGPPWSLLSLLDGVHHPMRPGTLDSTLDRIPGDDLQALQAHGFEIERLEMNHPGGAYGYRMTHGGRTFVHMPDNELRPPGPSPTTFETFCEFCEGADLLSHDAMFRADEQSARAGWGHSSVEQVYDLARAARIKHLVLFHHDPDRTDEALDTIQREARDRLAPFGIQCTVAYEGLSIDLNAH